jgi:putative transposase
MSRYRRARVAGASHFFTVNTYRRQTILIHTDTLRTLREAVRAVRMRLPFHLDALVLLPDHLHVVLALPARDDDYSSRISLIKRHVAQSARHLIVAPQTLSRMKRRELGFWQRRFWEHQIRNDMDYAKHVGHVHYNPVKHRLATRVLDVSSLPAARRISARLGREWPGR